MRTRPLAPRHARVQGRSIAAAVVFLAPLILVGYIGGTVASVFDAVAAFTKQCPPDPSTFLQANYSRFDEMARYYDARYEQFHIPLNLSANTLFTNASCTEVAGYQFTDNGAQWTGLAITAFVFKYLAGIREGDEALTADALRVIRKLLHGMSMLLAVPNGGLGPEFGGILARGWAGPEHRSFAGWYFEDADGQHRNGTGPYSQHRWRGYTSNDEHSGFYSGLALVLKHVPEADVQDLTRIMIDQIASHMINTNFLGIDWHGGPTGVHQRPLFFQGGAWASLLLKMAAVARPEKFERVYSAVMTREFHASWAREGSAHESVANYYAFAFGYHVFFALLQLEDLDTALGQLLLARYRGSLWEATRYHRNPFYNMIHLTLEHVPGENVDLERDVEDQLVRYDSPYHFPDRMLGTEPVPANRERVDIGAIIRPYTEGNLLAPLFSLIFSEIKTDLDYVKQPLTIEYMNGDIFPWESNPFVVEAPRYNPAFEFAGFSFSLIHWMGRAGSFFNASGMREVA